LLGRRSVLIAALGFCGCSEKKPASNVPVKRYALRGEVLRLEPSRMVAVVRHEAIEGWMEAMTMEFPVRDKAEFAKLSEGRRITAVVEVQDLDYWLTSINPL
jgi:Cu/Ag efflux protein CusF